MKIQISPTNKIADQQFERTKADATHAQHVRLNNTRMRHKVTYPKGDTLPNDAHVTTPKPQTLHNIAQPT